MTDSITIETDLFDHREVKSNFLNPCCFGEDFAQWLIHKLEALAALGFTFSQPIQEDYGWGFWSRRNRARFWIALSYVGDGPQEQPARWVVAISKPGFLARLSGASEASRLLQQQIWRELELEKAIQIIE